MDQPRSFRFAPFAALACAGIVVVASPTAEAQTAPPLPSEPTPAAPETAAPALAAPAPPGSAPAAAPPVPPPPPPPPPMMGARPGDEPISRGPGPREHHRRHVSDHGGHSTERWHHAPKGHHRPSFGGLGYASVGLMSGGFSAMQGTLAQPDRLGPGYDVAPAGFIGGGGGGALWNRLWLGGKGYGLAIDTSATESVGVSGGGGGFELGYAVVANERWLVVPFVGLGGFGYTVTVKNQGATPFAVYQGESIQPGAKSEFSAGFLTGELGIRASRLLFWGSGGVMLGAELGYTSSLQRGAWESSSGTRAPESAELRGAYFRLLIGGGGFSFHEARGGSHGRD